MAARPVSAPRIAPLLLAWYDTAHRTLPWRSPPGRPPPPAYAVWLSEIMLQQTTVPAVMPYFARFLARWPSVHDLAAAPLDDVMAAWAGLGYYARARNLHKCAQLVSTEHGGVFPDTEEALRALPGIGAYTAAAIAAIAFDRPAAVLDGNIERVLARLHAVDTPLPQAKPELRRLAAAATPQHRPGDYAQGMMDLGATICTPTTPACGTCPLAALCTARRLGLAADLPRKQPRRARPVRHAVAFLLQRTDDGAVLLRRRPPKGLLGGMLEVPSTPWREDGAWDAAAALAHAPLALDWQMLPGTAEHVFTHFTLKIAAVFATVTPHRGARLQGEWQQPGAAALPTAMRKMLALLPRADGATAAVRSTKSPRRAPSRRGSAPRRQSPPAR